MIKSHYFRSIENGNIHTTFSSMVKEFQELYDGMDETNVFSWNEYYDEIFELEDGTIIVGYVE